MDDRTFDTFLAVVRNDGIGAAAAELHLSQSAVSHRIEALEKSLGTVLFRRGRGIRGIQLTPSGARLLPLATARAELNRQITSVATGSESVSIGAPHSAIDVLARGLRAAASNSQSVHLRFTIANHDQLIPAVRRRLLDVAISPLRQPSNDLSSELLGTEPYRVVRAVGTGLDSEEGSEISARDLAAENEVRIHWADLGHWHQKHWPDGRSLVEIDSVYLLPVLLTQPNAWSIVPLSTARQLQGRGFSIRELSEALPERSLYWVSRRNQERPLADLIQQVRDRIEAALDPGPTGQVR